MEEKNVIGGFVLPPSVFALFRVMDYEDLGLLFAYLMCEMGTEQEEPIWSKLCCIEHGLAYAAWILIRDYNEHLDSNNK